jgi:ring-1,2-phenylacetyl-CoA epoxidase subunit PaaB
MVTQLPRYQVFIQEQPGSPFIDVGSVHAPDAELALLNARDVFARRPECVHMWVVPVSEIRTYTSQEMNSIQPGVFDSTINPEIYFIFGKLKQAGTQTFLGEVEANSLEQAFHQAIDRFSGKRPPLVWLLFAARAITASNQEDVPFLFHPAKEKGFRMASDFHTVTAMRSIKSKQIVHTEEIIPGSEADDAIVE